MGHVRTIYTLRLRTQKIALLLFFSFSIPCLPAQVLIYGGYLIALWPVAELHETLPTYLVGSVSFRFHKQQRRFCIMVHDVRLFRLHLLTVRFD